MKMLHKISLMLLVSVSLPALAATRDAKVDTTMMNLSTKAGCTTCHAVESTTDGTPIGPAWHDVAVRYHDDKSAVDKLTAIVQDGSNPYARHWKDKSTGLAMPPNAVAISTEDTRKLVSWILTLNKP